VPASRQTSPFSSPWWLREPLRQACQRRTSRASLNLPSPAWLTTFKVERVRAVLRAAPYGTLVFLLLQNGFYLHSREGCGEPGARPYGPLALYVDIPKLERVALGSRPAPYGRLAIYLGVDEEERAGRPAPTALSPYYSAQPVERRGLVTKLSPQGRSAWEKPLVRTGNIGFRICTVLPKSLESPRRIIHSLSHSVTCWPSGLP
jgi:hypothetical protein